MIADVEIYFFFSSRRRHTRLQGDWSSDVCSSDLADKAMRFIGLNLTVPHKILALDIVDVVEQSARNWGAVNTIRFEGIAPSGEWRPLPELDVSPKAVRSHGFNTDADAITRAIEEDLGIVL